MIKEIKNVLKNEKMNRRFWINIFLALLSYLGLVLYNNLNENFSIFFFLLFIGLVAFFQKTKISENIKIKKMAYIISFIITMLVVTGGIVYSFIFDTNRMIFTINQFIRLIIEFICFFPFFNRLLNCFYELVINKKFDIIVKQERKDSLKFFAFAFLTMIISYLFYFYCYYPGKLSYDSHVQLSQIVSGNYSNHHPYFHTRLIGIFYNIGLILFHNENAAIATYTIFQMIIMALLFAYVCKYLYEKKVNLIICFLVLFSFAFLPQYTHYSITMWKDVLFGGAFVLILISLLEFLNNNFSIKQIIVFIIGLLMMLFFRNNGIYIVIFMIPFILFKFRNKIKLFSIILGCLVIFYYVIEGPIFNVLGVDQTSPVESLSIPLQQIARVFASDKDVDDKLVNELNNYIDVANLKENYLAYISDPVKRLVRTDAILENKIGFAKAWFSLFIKYPQIYVESYLSQTLGYWFPNVSHYVTPVQEPTQTNILTKIIDFSTNKGIPFAGLFWGIGSGFIILLLSITISILKKKQNMVLYSPFIGLWLTMMIASPVFGEFRYVYGLFTCLPLIILIPFLKDGSLKN